MKDWSGKMRLCVVYAISTSDTMCCLHMIVYMVVMCMRSVCFLFIVWIFHCLITSSLVGTLTNLEGGNVMTRFYARSFSAVSLISCTMFVYMSA